MEVIRNIKVQRRNDLSAEIWPTYFAIVIWWIWRWRNAVAFGRTNEIPIDVRTFLLERFEEVWRIVGDGEPGNAGNVLTRRENFIKWIAPPAGWMSLNSDGAAKGSPGPAGGGGIIRDNAGRMKYAYSLKLGHCMAFKAEVLAVEYGLELALRMRIKNLQVQVDNQALAHILNSSDDYNGECIHDILHCKSLIAKLDWEVNVIHIYREANQAADWLANQGILQNNKFELIQVPPLALGRILHNDVVGVAVPRLVPH